MRIITLLIIGSILFLSLLGLRGLCEPDEGRYAEIGREMLESGDWLVPRLNYIKHFHKPPLVYWLVAGSFVLFGVNEFAARLPIAVLGVGGLIITYLLSIRMGKDRTTSLVSGITLATTLQYFGWTQVLSSDMAFSFFILLTFYGFWNKSYLFYLGLALGFMTKGPVALVIVGLVVGVYALTTKERFFRKKQILVGAMLFFAIVTPWFIYVCMKNPGLFRYFIFFQSLDRLFTDVHGRTGNLFYFIPVVLIGGLPWIVFTPHLVISKILQLRDLKSHYTIPIFERQQSEQGAGFIPWAIGNNNRFLLLWIVIPIAFFSISGSKLPGYILPIYPAVAIAIGDYLKKKRLFFVLYISASVIYLIGAGLIAKNEEKLGENLSIRKPAGIIKKYISPSDKIINFRCFLQGLPFYLKRRVILVERIRETQFEEDLSRHKDYLIPRISEFKNAGRFWAFTKLKDYPDLQKNFSVPLYEIWKCSDYILVSNYEI